MSEPTPPRPDDDAAAAPGAPQEGAPPPGPDGAAPTPSEFLTPVRPYETVSPHTERWPETSPEPSLAPPERGRPPRRRSGLGVAVVTVVVVAAALAWIVADRASTPPVGAPRDLRATVGVCSTPACERIDGFATLTWSAPDGDVDAYEIVRSQRVVDTVRADARTYEARGLRIDRVYVFGVRAVRGSQRGPTSIVEVRTPAPPIDEAQLAGVYRVRERVRRASHLASVEGIRHPRPGSSTVNMWTFAPTCEPHAGACPTSWFSWGPLRNVGPRYDGTFRSAPASCAGARSSPTTTELHLTSVAARTIDGRWTVQRFRGSMRVTFRCAGGPRSVGLLHVEGTVRSLG